MRVNNSAMNLEVRKGSESSINHVVKNLDIFDPLRGHYVKNGHLADPHPSPKSVHVVYGCPLKQHKAMVVLS